MSNKSLKIMFSLILFTTAQVVYSQLNYLQSGTSNILGTYTDLGTNGTSITTANFDNSNSAPQNIGFTFLYNGSAFTQFVLNTNGFIKLGNTNPSIDSLFFTSGITGGVFNSTDAADVNIISIFNLDLQAGVATPEYRVFTSGSAGSRICTIQFKNVRGKIAPIQFDNMEFQIKLYETTNTIEFIYGTWIPSTVGTSSTKIAAVGLKGINNTNTELLVVSKPSVTAWSGASFISGNYTSIAFNYGKPTKPLPEAGRTFRFVQAFQNDAIVHLFTLGNIPIVYGAPRIDSAVIRNIGINPLTNIVVTLNITGANSFTDNKTILSLAPGAWASVGFAAYSPGVSGTNNVSVSISNDDNNANNTDVYTQIVNNTIFSYADAGKSVGGIGSQNNDGYLLAKYTITGTTAVTAANIYIAGDAASIGQSVYAILFDDLGNKLDSSAALTITASDTGKYNNFLLPQTPTIANSSFYIGLKQLKGFNALGYQYESPTRLGSFFIRDMNSSIFMDLGGTPGWTPYRLMIQAVITNTTGVLKNVSENNIVAYPNPFSNSTTFNIGSESTGYACFYLYDAQGRIVKTIKNISTSEFKLEREDLQSGMYFYTLNGVEKMISSGKLIIE